MNLNTATSIVPRWFDCLARIPRNSSVRVTLVLLGLVFATSLFAAPFPPEGKTTEWVQPDGTVLKLRVFGDEFYGRTTTEDGYTVVFDANSKSYFYAQRDPDSGEFKAMQVEAGKPVPENLEKNLKESPTVISAKHGAMVEYYAPDRDKLWDLRVKAVRAKQAKDNAQPMPADYLSALGEYSPEQIAALGTPVTGTRVGLTILVQFPDDSQTATSDAVAFPTTLTKIQRYCNEVGYTDDGNTGSIRDYYSDQSLGQLTFTQSVSSIITLPHPRNYYNYSNYPTNTALYDSGQTGRLLVGDAIAALKSAGFNFSTLTVNGSNQVVSTSLMFAGADSGVWAQGLWPHAWSLSGSGINVGTTANPRYIYRYQCTNVASSAPVIGTMCHELGHLLLGYPDLYDTDANDGDSEGVGNHCLMGAANHLNSGKTPGPIDLYLKEMVGWATITDLTPTQSQSVTLSTTSNTGYRIRKPGASTEYFLFENRGSGDKWAASSPDKGVLIWHVDEAVTTGNQRQQMTSSQHYLISVEQADGLFNLENNVNRGDVNDLFDSSSNRFSDSTTPNANWWSGSASGIAVSILSAAGAAMNVQFGTSSTPSITSALTANAGTGISFSYQITASNSPTSYSALSLPSGLTVNTSTGLISGSVSASGTYSITIRATNGSGTGSATLVLTVATPRTSLSDDFDPNYDSTLWAQFGSTVAANTNGQAAGTGSTGNSLWFGGDGSRFATTVSMDTRSGGTVAFKLALAGGSADPWENADSGEEVVLEYSNDGTTFTQIGGPYSSKTWQSLVVTIPAAAQTSATQFRFLQLSNSGAAYDHWALEDVVIGSGAASAPEIAVEQPAGYGLTDGSASISFGPALVSGSNSLTFAIRNDGNANLTGLGITINGTNPADFTVTSSPVAPLLPGAVTTFVVRFTPSALGNRVANLHIANNDSNENPFDITLTGTGVTAATNFADDFDPNYDSALWALFGATVAANTNGQAAGTGSTANSLWFGGDGDRYARTVAIDTRTGGNVSFKLALGNGASSPWESADTGEEVVLEYSNNGGTYTQIGGPYSNKTWQTLTVAIPAAAQTAATQFQFRQLANSGADYDHWAIDDVLIGNGAASSPEITVEQPVGTSLSDGSSTVGFGAVSVGGNNSLSFTIRNDGTGNLTGLGISIDGTNAAEFTVSASPTAPVAPGANTTFTVRFAPTAQGSRSANLHIASNDSNEASFDIALSGSGTTGPTGTEFRILTLGYTGSAVVDHDALTGDDRGGIAVGHTRVFVTGDNASASYTTWSLIGGTAMTRLDGLCSDLSTGESYTLAYNGTPHTSGATAINQLIRLDSNTGATTSTVINLSRTITVGYGCGVFSGYGRVVLHNGSEVFDINVSTGSTASLGLMSAPSWYSSESWAIWGVAEFYSGQVYLAYRSSAAPSIVRSRVPDGSTSTIATFTNISDLSSWSVSTTYSRWYFHHEYSGQFGGANETLGYADATFSIGSAAAPSITSAPTLTIGAGVAMSYQITATNSPTSFGASGLPSGLSINTSTGIISGSVASGGNYTINLSATNAFGTGTGSLALTVINSVNSFFDDFDPDYDSALWSQFGGIVAANTNGQAAGSGSTGNSLWFGGDGARFATTVPVDTRSGGTISFKLAMAGGGSSPWEYSDAGEEAILEYSNDGVSFTQLDGPYTNKTWQTFAVAIPVAARTAATRFRFSQISNSGADYDHWAIEDVSIGSGIAAPEIAVYQPASVSLTDGSSTVDFGSVAAGSSTSLTFTISNLGTANLTGLGVSIDGSNPGDFSVTSTATAPVTAGNSTTFTVRFSPSVQASRSANLHIANNDSNENPFDIALTGIGTAVSTSTEFRIQTLGSTGVTIVDHNALTSDDRGGIALSGSRVFVTGDGATAAFDINNLTGGVSVGSIIDGLCSDIATRNVYVFANSGTPFVNGNTTINQLIQLSSTTGAQTSTVVTLSRSISVGYGSGIFSGYGRVVFYNGSEVFEIALPSGLVTSLGTMTRPAWYFSENWAVWGVAESISGQTYLAYRNAADASIVRTRVPDGYTQTIATFSNISDLASWSISPALNRWYFHHEYGSQFGGSSETLGYADATFYVGAAGPPVINSSSAITVAVGSPMSFQVTATNSPTSYVASGLPSALSMNSTSGLISGTVANVGVSTVNLSATNSTGTGTATLTITAINPPTSFFDDFDPGYDSNLWSQFGATVLANQNGAAAGAGSSGNSLWFGGDGTRFATTLALDTRTGGHVAFSLALGSTTSYPWESADSGEEVIVEYSTDGGVNFTQIGATYTNRNWQRITLPIPAAAQTASTKFRFRQLSNSGADYDHWALEDVQIGSGIIAAPEIAIEDGAGFGLHSGSSSITMAPTYQGLNSQVSYNLKNYGAALLSGLNYLIDGSNSGDFVVSTNGGTSLSPGDTILVNISFTPQAIGTRTARLLIFSNDGDENPFDIALTGEGLDVNTGAVVIRSISGGAMVALGNAASLSVTATGAPPLKYQWRHNRANIANATQSGYDIPAAQLNQAGAYDCVVSNTFGTKSTATSSSVEIAVIDDQTKNVALNIGASTTISVSAAGNGLTYQWMKDGIDVPSATSKSLKIGPFYSVGTTGYSCHIASAPLGLVFDSNVANVSIYDSPPIIILPPGSSLPPAMVGDTYDFAIPVDIALERTPSRFSAKNLPPGLSIDASTGVIHGSPTAGRATNYEVTLTAANSAGSSVVKVTLSVASLPPGLVGQFVAPLPSDLRFNNYLGGRLDLTCSVSGAVSGKIFLGANTYPFSGRMETDYSSPNNALVSLPVLRRGELPMYLGFNIDSSSGMLTGGTISDSQGVIYFEGWRNTWSRSNEPTSFAGYYTLALTSSGGYDVPQGKGYASFSISGTTGALSVLGKLADKTVIQWSTFVGPNGQVAAYQLLYGVSKRGAISGRFDISVASQVQDNSLMGMLTWLKPDYSATSDHLYSAGFGPVQLTAAGGFYSPPQSPDVIMGLDPLRLDNAVLNFTAPDGNSISPAPSPDVLITVGAQSKITYPTLGSSTNQRRTTLTLSASKGTFSGGFAMLDPNPFDANKSVSRPGVFYGILVNQGAGVTRGFGFYILSELPSYLGQPANITPMLSGQVFLGANPP